MYSRPSCDEQANMNTIKNCLTSFLPPFDKAETALLHVQKNPNINTYRNNTCMCAFTTRHDHGSYVIPCPTLVEPLRCCSIRSSHDRRLHNKHTFCCSVLNTVSTLQTQTCRIAILPHGRPRATLPSRVPSLVTPLLIKVPVLEYVYHSLEMAGKIC